ncbi:M56 family peptidase [Kibdelosporangium aridum]|uniref:M56 family peptidase n=1 Tax=Kibdelosporangium aridum TaxID=2030 RepID=A0A428ZHR7_KIBAR|nr:M56 family metallopeptidase [Kibdelosporangium aridum]RSM87605.1 M56 family peptidase [Kibdelosporangium aridum]
MTGALALLFGVVVVGWGLPRLLNRADLWRHDPLPVMVGLLVAMAGLVIAAVAGVALLLVPGHGVVPPLLGVLHHCWSALRHGSPPRVEELVGLLGAVVLLGITLRVVIVGPGARWRRARTRRKHLSEAGSPSTWWLAHDRPLAFSLAGRPGVIVATDGLAEHLDPAAVGAVLAHERAHLRGRHHFLVGLVESLATALPFIPLFRLAPRMMRQLVELAADVAAVREYGAPAVRTALLTVSGHGSPGVALAMGRDSVAIRLQRLRDGGMPTGRLRRAVSCGVAGAGGVLVPFLAGAVMLLVLAVLTCPIGA